MAPSSDSLLALDQKLTGHLRLGPEYSGLLRIGAFLAHSGDSWFWLLGLLVIWFTGSDAWKARAILLSAAIIVTAVLVLLIKFTVRRSRPEGDWGDVYRKTDPHSFPSGHAARGALIAAMAVGLGPPWFAIATLIWAPLVSLARVAMGVHYLSDIIAGSLLGAGLGIFFLWLI
jgi:undecaprenyl-diphosphatase